MLFTQQDLGRKEMIYFVNWNYPLNEFGSLFLVKKYPCFIFVYKKKKKVSCPKILNSCPEIADFPACFFYDSVHSISLQWELQTVLFCLQEICTIWHVPYNLLWLMYKNTVRTYLYEGLQNYRDWSWFPSQPMAKEHFNLLQVKR